MIIIRISGGLGNQMFQYAFGRTLALKHNTELVFDISFFSSAVNKAQNREFLLNSFNIQGRVADEKDFEKIGITPPLKVDLLSRLQRKLTRIFESLKPIEGKKFIIEKGFTFDQKYLNTPNNCYCAGIWQTEKYFVSNKIILKEELVLKKALSSEAEDLFSKIKSSNSASIHFRRGDYVTNPLANKKHGTADLEYYEKSVNYILNLIPGAQFYVFSDDIKWVKENVLLPSNTIYVSSPNISNVEEMFLMSACTHNILSNSSFGWWAAWLNRNPQKIVIAPKRWFNFDIDTKDLVPETWIRF